MISKRAHRPLYLQLADLLRAQIRSGELRPGDRLPAVARMAYEHDLGRDTVKAAVKLLRGEGLVETRVPLGTFVVSARSVQEVSLQRGSRISVRMPTPEEQEEYDIPAAVPVAVVVHGARTRVFPTDRWTFVAK